VAAAHTETAIAAASAEAENDARRGSAFLGQRRSSLGGEARLNQNRLEALMRYRTHQQWPVHGGSMVIPGETDIDDSTNPLLAGVVPPPDVTPLDEATRQFLVSQYPGHVIAPVPQVSTATKQRRSN
jgi:hypothetical protein